MEEQISTVSAVQADGTWESKYGLMYSFEYTMKDGTSLKANHKKNEPYQPGTQVAYVVKKDDQYGKSGKVYLPNYTPKDSTAGQKNYGDDNLKGIKIGHSLTNAVSLVCALGKVQGQGLEQSIKTYAQLILKIADDLNEDKYPPNPLVTEKAELPVEQESDLPF